MKDYKRRDLHAVGFVGQLLKKTPFGKRDFFLFLFCGEVLKSRQSRGRWQSGNVRVDNHRGVGCGSERASHLHCIRLSFRTSWRPELAGPQYAGDFAIAYCDQRMLWLDVFIMVLVVDFG